MQISLEDVQAQSLELLPARSALGHVGLPWVNVYATNQALALNAGAWHSHATALAYQGIYIG